MFENIIEQPAVSQLKNDIAAGNLAQSMLFFGPPDTAKGSAALELARVLSCEKEAAWKCACPSCGRHRYLQHDDLQALGKRKFSSEIAAACSVFKRNPNDSSKLLFYRALRKLQIRFSPVITGDDPKISKISSLIQSFDEKMNDFFSLDANAFTDSAGSEKETAAQEKLCAGLVKDSLALEEEGISANIPIGQIRGASYWCRLAPSGKRKFLIIENAENMRDEARNSLLKLLEEPPPSVSIVLTSQRKESIIPTILSRVRPYRFLIRSGGAEKEILKRIFHFQDQKNNAENSGSLISAYLDSFLSSGADKLYPLAKWFTEQDYSFNNAQIVRALLAKSNNFENDSFPRFLKLCLDITAEQVKKAEGPKYIKYYDLYKKYFNDAQTATEVYNQSVAAALEALLYKLKTGMERYA